MSPRLITFDCAQTLVEVDWTVNGFVRSCAEDVGLALPEDAFLDYRRRFEARLPQFLEVNRDRDAERRKMFWRQLGTEWLGEWNQDASWILPIEEAADRLGFGNPSILFRPYDDVMPTLELLRQKGIRMAVVSNWDYSLHRVLEMFGLTPYFDLALASLEEGVEKPDPAFFNICLERLGFAPEETLHIGDNPIDDVEGATAAGIRPIRIVRDDTPEPGEIASFHELPGVLGWSA